MAKEKEEIAELEVMHRELNELMDTARELARGYGEAKRDGMHILEKCKQILTQLVHVERKIAEQFKIRQLSKSKLEHLKEEIIKIEKFE